MSAVAGAGQGILHRLGAPALRSLPRQAGLCPGPHQVERQSGRHGPQRKHTWYGHTANTPGTVTLLTHTWYRHTAETHLVLHITPLWFVTCPPAVHLAAAEGHVLCLKFLVLKGGGLARTLQARNNEGENPRDLAVRFLKHPVLQCLEELSQHTDSPEEEDGTLAAFPLAQTIMRNVFGAGLFNTILGVSDSSSCVWF